MQRLLMSLVLIAMFAVAALTAAPLILSMDGYKAELVKAIKTATGLDAEVNGEVKVSFLPFPVIKVNNVSIANIDRAASAYIFYVESISVDSSFKSVLTGKVELSTIQLDNPVLELEKLKDDTKNWQMVIDSIAKQETSANVRLPDKIIINNGTIAYREKDKKRTIDYISARVTADSMAGPFALKGNFSSNEMVVKFDGKIGKFENGSESKFDLSSDDFILKLTGKYQDGDNPGIVGEVDGGTSNLGSFVKIFFDVDSAFAKIKSAEGLDILGNFNITKKTATFTDVAMTSDSIKGRANIDALIGGKNEVVQWDVEVNVDKIDFDKLAGEADKPKADEVDYYASTLNTTSISDYKFDIPQNLNTLLTISIAEMTYNTQKVVDLKLDADIFSGKAIINSFSAALPGNSKVEFSGSVDNNGTRPLLSGLVSSSGASLRTVLTWLDTDLEFIPKGQMGEYLFTSNLKMTPQKMDVSNIHLSADKTLITGDVSMRPARAVPVINAALKVDRLDFDRYNFTPNINKTVSDFFSNVAAQNLENSWLYMLGTRIDLSVDASELTYNKNKIDNAFFSVIISKGTFSLQRFMIHSEVATLDANARIDIVSERPSVELNISSSNFDTALFVRDEESAKEKVAKVAWEWPNKPFNLLGLDRFDGKTNIIFNSFKHKDIDLKNVSLDGVLEKQVISFSQANAELLGGKFVMKGSLGVNAKNPSFGLSMVLSNIDFKPFLDLFTDGIETSGKFFFSGTAKTFGPTPLKWINELTVDGKIVGRNISVNKFDLNSIVTKAGQVYSAIDMDAIVKKALTEGVTIFDTVEGTVTTGAGVLKGPGFKVATKTTRGVLAGNVSLVNGDLKGGANLMFRPEADKQVVLGVNLGGTAANVQRTLDTSQLESYITAKGGR